MVNQRISILGCGWLGLDLARALLELGCIVKGSTTSQDRLNLLKQNGIEPFLINLTPHGILGEISDFLSESTILIIAVPPGLRKNPSKNLVGEMQYLKKEIGRTPLKYLLYISSTSVFKDDYDVPTVRSNTIPANNTASAKQLVQVEQLLCDIPTIKTTVLRFGGLIGKDRHPGFFLQGRKNLSNPKAPINLIHKTDCIAIITKIIEQGQWDRTFNAAYPYHPSRSAYYIDFALKNGLKQPQFNEIEPSKGKIIDSSDLAQALRYRFQVKP